MRFEIANLLEIEFGRAILRANLLDLRKGCLCCLKVLALKLAQGVLEFLAPRFGSFGLIGLPDQLMHLDHAVNPLEFKIAYRPTDDLVLDDPLDVTGSKDIGAHEFV